MATEGVILSSEMLTELTLARLATSPRRNFSALKELDTVALRATVRGLLDSSQLESDVHAELAPQVKRSSFNRFAGMIRELAAEICREVALASFGPLALSPEAAAGALGVEPAVVDALIAAGDLPAIDLAGQVVIPMKALRTAIEPRARQAPARSAHRGSGSKTAV